MENRYNIKIVSERTGLSPQLIRTWEKRYSAITPQRSQTKRRLYSENDIEKLILLKRGTSVGLAISTIAHLSTAELQQLLDKREKTDRVAEGFPKLDDASLYHLNNCISAVKAFDYPGLETSLLNAVSALGQQTLIEKVIHPLLNKTGNYWLEGEFLIAQEHMVSTIVRSLLGSMLVSGRVSSSGPTLLVTTPPGQIHELGALMSAVTALSLGWKIIYLGPNLPIEEIANAVVKQKADAIALSITYPLNDSTLHIDLERLRKIVGPDMPVYVGGQGAVRYQAMLEKADLTLIENLTIFKTILTEYSKQFGSNVN